MSTITSSSTIEDINAAFLDNVSYQEDGSVAKCRAFITAALALLIHRPKFIGNGPQQIAFDPVQLRKEIETARQWQANSIAAGNRNTRHFSLEGFRG